MVKDSKELTDLCWKESPKYQIQGKEYVSFVDACLVLAMTQPQKIEMQFRFHSTRKPDGLLEKPGLENFITNISIENRFYIPDGHMEFKGITPSELITLQDIEKDPKNLALLLPERQPYFIKNNEIIFLLEDCSSKTRVAHFRTYKVFKTPEDAQKYASGKLQSLQYFPGMQHLPINPLTIGDYKFVPGYQMDNGKEKKLAELKMSLSKVNNAGAAESIQKRIAEVEQASPESFGYLPVIKIVRK